MVGANGIDLSQKPRFGCRTTVPMLSLCELIRLRMEGTGWPGISAPDFISRATLLARRSYFGTLRDAVSIACCPG